MLRNEIEIDPGVRPECIDFEGKIFRPVSSMLGGYIYPYNEEAFINLHHSFWRYHRPVKVDAYEMAIGRFNDRFVGSLELLSERLERSGGLSDFISPGGKEIFVGMREGVIGYHPDFSPRRYLVDHMIEQIRALHKKPRSIIEVGCGTGGFLFELRMAFPDIEICGLEPAAAGAESARKVSRHFGLDIEIIEGPIEEVAGSGRKFDLAYTHGVLTQIPRHPVEVLKEIQSITNRWVHLYEMFTDLLPLTPLGYASLYYLTNVGRYQTGCFFEMQQAENQFYSIKQASPLRNVRNAFEEPVFVQLELLK